SDRQIRRILVKHGVKMRKAGKTPIHDVNIEFFKRWTPEMAYVLGFIVTDGCITQNQITIAQKERHILEIIADIMGATTPVTERSNNGGRTAIFTLNICRTEMVNDLAKLGISSRKSLVVPFPNVPDDLMPHFLRGVIDGDGWVHHKGYTMSVISASPLFAERLFDVLSDRGFNTRVVIDCSGKTTYYRVYVSGKEDIYRLGKWLYRDCGHLYLPRKRERFEYHNAS
ncbi:LAGLIDADG family homing endonuclease, partial [Brevibacillus laterosporus]